MKKWKNTGVPSPGCPQCLSRCLCPLVWTLWKAAELPSEQFHSSQTLGNMSGPVCVPTWPRSWLLVTPHMHIQGSFPKKGTTLFFVHPCGVGACPTAWRAPCGWGLLPHLAMLTGSMPQGRLLGSCWCSPPICRQVESPLFLAESPPCCWESFACPGPTSASPSPCLSSKLHYLLVPGRGRGCAHHLLHLWL